MFGNMAELHETLGRIFSNYSMELPGDISKVDMQRVNNTLMQAISRKLAEISTHGGTPETSTEPYGTNVTSGNQSNFNGNDYLLFLFIFYTLIMGPICIVGFLGNMISIIVLSKDKSNQVVTFLLKCLAIADNSVIAFSFMFLSIVYSLIPYQYGISSLKDIKPYLYKYGNPLGYVAQTLTVWTTVLLAINRYIAICRPFDAKRLCTINKARLQVLLVFAMSIVFNVPRLFQVKIVWTTHDNETHPYIVDTSIGQYSVFGIVFTNVLFSIFVLVLPLVVLLFVNTKLIRELKRMRKRSQPHTRPNSKEGGERNITVVMVIIILVLIVCHTPDRIAQAMALFLPRKMQIYPSAGGFFKHIANLLIVLNSSSNFFVYYILRQRFRRILFKMLPCRKDRPEAKDGESSTLNGDRNTDVSTHVTRERSVNGII